MVDCESHYIHALYTEVWMDARGINIVRLDVRMSMLIDMLPGVPHGIVTYNPFKFEVNQMCLSWNHLFNCLVTLGQITPYLCIYRFRMYQISHAE